MVAQWLAIAAVLMNSVAVLYMLLGYYKRRIVSPLATINDLLARFDAGDRTLHFSDPDAASEVRELGEMLQAHADAVAELERQRQTLMLSDREQRSIFNSRPSLWGIAPSSAITASSPATSPWPGCSDAPSQSLSTVGTGHSSLVQLRDIPFTELKVDRGFVNGARLNQFMRPILEGSIALASRLGMKSVAEGVETEDDWQLMRELGCDVAQGWFVARPMPAEGSPIGSSSRGRARRR